MASVNLSTDSTEHGWLQPGWSQEESASPHVIGDQGGETRQTSFQAIAKADSDLMIGKTLNATGPFDSSGIMLETSLVGDIVSTSSYDVDSKFLPRRDFPSVVSGYTEDVLDHFQRQFGQGGVTVPWQGVGKVHAYYPLRGYFQGYTVDGQNQPYYQGTWFPSTFVEYSTFSQVRAPNAIEVLGGFIRKAEGSYAQTVRPLWSAVDQGTNVNYGSYTVRLGVGDEISTRLNISNGFGNAPETLLECIISRTTGTAGTLTIQGQIATVGAGTATTITATSTATTGLDMSKEIRFVLQWGFLTSAQPGATLRVKMYAFDPDSPPVGAPPVVLSTDFSNVVRYKIISSNSFIYRRPGTVDAGFRDLILSQSDGTWPVYYPVINEPSMIVDNSTRTHLDETPPLNVYSFQGTVPPWTGSGWDYLKMLASARGLQFKVVGGQLVFSDLFPIGSVKALTHAIQPPVLRISAPGRSRSIDVVAHKSMSRFYDQGPNNAPGGYHALSLSVNWHTTVTTQVPVMEGDINIGQVYPLVEDSTGAPVTWPNFWQAHGRCEATLGRDGMITLKFRGPDRKYPGLGTGPWSITGVQVLYSGVLYKPERITLYTGAPEEMVTRDKAGDVDNPFLNSQADVFDRSTWLISSEGSPRVTLDFSVPTTVHDDYQVGQIVSYGWGNFRVMSVTSTKGTTQVSCDWFATQDQQSANWSGLTANQWKTYWTGKRAYDVFLRPLASSAPVVNPLPFTRVYPSESERAV